MHDNPVQVTGILSLLRSSPHAVGLPGSVQDRTHPIPLDFRVSQGVSGLPVHAMTDPSSSVSLSQFLKHWSRAEGDAIERIHRDYFPRLRALARRKLGDIPGGAVEAEDVVQSALKSLCRYMRREHDASPRRRDDIWRLLCTIVVRKARRLNHRHTRRGHVRPATDLDPDGRGLEQRLAEIPVHELDVLVDDALQQLDAPLQRIALLTMEGRTQEEIATLLGCSRRTIIRKLELIRALLSGQLDP
jgi:RNA polymerase sigma factor (sigma-70 family)